MSGKGRYGAGILAAGVGLLFDHDGDLIRYNGWIVRYVYLVAQDQLQRMFTRGQFYRDLGLTSTKVPVPRIGDQGFFQIGKAIYIDQQMVMPGLRLVGASRCHPHAGKSESDGYRAVDGIAVGR